MLANSRTVLAAFVVLLGVVLAQAQSTRPAEAESRLPLIPVGPEAYTQAKFEKEVSIPFYTREIVEAYKQHGVRDPKWDDAALAFLEKMVKYEADAPDAPWLDEAHEEAERLENKLRCTDPLVRYYYYRLVMERWGWCMDRAKSIAIPDDMKKQGYSDASLAVAYTWCIAVTHRWGNQDDTPAIAQLAAEHWHRAIADPANQGDVQRVLYARFEAIRNVVATKLAIYNTYKKMDTNIWLKLADRLLADEKVDRWTAHLFKGKFEIEAAWDDRGGGYTDTVTPEGWKGFAGHLRIADKHLRAAYAANPRRPEAPALLIIVAAAGEAPPNEDLMYWFQRTVNIQMDYMHAYDLMLNFLRPRWGGSHSLMLAMGMKCAATERYDTLVPYALSNFIYSVYEDIDRKWEPLIDSGVVRVMLRVLQKMEKEPRWEGGRRKWQSAHAAFATRLGDYAEANRVIREMKRTPIRAYTRNVGYLGYSELTRNVPARGGPAAKEVLAADEQYEKDNYQAAAEGYRAALEQLPADDRGRKYILDRLKAIEWRNQFDKGEWVRLEVESNLTGWEERCPEWRAKDGILMGRTTGEIDPPRILCEARFGHRFEYEAQMEFDKNMTYTWYSGAAVFVHADHPWRFRSFNIYPNADHIAICRDFVFGDIVPFGKDVPLQCHLRIVVYDKGSLAYLNGELVHNSPWIKPDEIFGVDERVGFGIRLSDGGRDYRMLKISNIRIRKLTEKPAEMN